MQRKCKDGLKERVGCRQAHEAGVGETERGEGGRKKGREVGGGREVKRGCKTR